MSKAAMPAEINSGLINNRYQIQKVLGQGGFGRTYLALDTQRFDDPCVLKEFIVSGTPEDITQKSRELFAREAKVLHFINHPQIPKFLAWFTEQERLFIVQEYIDGKTYSQLLLERVSQQNQAFSEAEVTQWLIDMLPVFDYLHGLKIIHRDVSLDNLMFPNDQSKPMLIDFGLVKEKVSQIWAVGTVLGKIGYAPPEQLRIGKSYPSSDLYALAVCAIVLLTGKMPDMLMDHSLEWQWHEHVKVSDSLASVLDKMLAEKPTQRYQSAQEILVEIQQPSLPHLSGVSQPLKKLQINIDETNKEREVAEIVESDEFKLLEQKAISLRNITEEESEFQFEPHTPENLAPPLETIISPPVPEDVVASEKSEAKTPPLNPQFVEHCRHELTRCIGPIASVVLEEILTEFPQIAASQLIEDLALEIPNPQRAQEFKKRIKIYCDRETSSQKKTGTHTAPAQPVEVSQTTPTVVAELNPQVESSHSFLPPTIVVQPVNSHSENPLAAFDSTHVQRRTAHLIHVQTDRQIELPQNLSVIYIGKPNNNIPPNVDISGFPGSEFVSRVHACIRVEADGVSIEDLGSANGTFINNLQLSPGNRYRLRPGDCISLGQRDSVTFVFQLF